MAWKKMTPWNWLTREEASGGSPMTPTRRTGGMTSLAGLHQEIDDLFDQAFRGFGFPGLFERGAGVEDFLKPKLDIKEGAGGYTITAEVPGMEKSDLQVEVRNDMLIIRGEKRQEEKNEEEQYHYTERSYGSVQRVLSLPDDADSDKMDASFKNGVLTIKLPRRKEAKSHTRTVEIK